MSGGVIVAVAPGSLGERAGLQPGDEILAINGRYLRDIIDVRFYSAEERLALQVRRNGRGLALDMRRQYGEPLGLDFAQPVFGPIRRCTNRCEFCFVAQMPPGLRRSLTIKDDDYRYSFLFGSYVTLTNLDEADWERIGEQHLSPLYVSIHATDPNVRQRVLDRSGLPDVMTQLQRLADLGIEVHTQIVVTPGLNDGDHLDRSIGDLSLLYPAVRSVSVVPVGLTKFHRGGCRVHSDAEMRVVLDQVVGWQDRLREQVGIGFVYLSDEWYLRLGERVPPLESYDGLDLTENGVGMVRQFLDAGVYRPPPEIAPSGSRTFVTGALFGPLLGRLVAISTGDEVVPVVNRFFGETVTVAGLLTGRDVVAQLRNRELGDRVMLPPAMFGGPDGQSVDEMWPGEIGETLGREVVVGWG